MGITCFSCSKNHKIQHFQLRELTEEKTIMFVGSKESGKSSLIYYLKNGNMKKSFNQSQIVEQTNIRFNDKLYDIKELQNFKDQLVTDAWVYVADMSKTQDCNDMFDFINKVENKVPVLIYLNKNDLMSQDLSLDTSKLKQIKDKKFQIFCSNNKGEGIIEGFKWLHSQLYPENEKDKLQIFDFYQLL